MVKGNARWTFFPLAIWIQKEGFSVVISTQTIKEDGIDKYKLMRVDRYVGYVTKMLALAEIKKMNNTEESLMEDSFLEELSTMLFFLNYKGILGN